MKAFKKTPINVRDNPTLYFFGYFVFLGVIFLFSKFNIAVQVSAFICFLFILFTNEKINEDNFGKIAIAHMISVFLMIAGYEHFSKNISRDVLFLNMGAAGSLSAFIAGSFLNYWHRHKK